MSERDERFRLNRRESRFEIPLEGGTATLEFREAGDAVLDFESTFVPEEHRGGGTGSELVRGALDWARANGYRIIPSCPFVESYVAEHEDEYGELVAEREPARGGPRDR